QCGCWHDGKHYPVGSEFWTDDTCSTKCTCPSRGGKLTCSATSCPKDYYCGISNGVPGCYPHTYGICRVHNDPHYNTFDKATHHFMGTCTYTLAKLCTNSSSLPYFNVEAKNENRGHPSISYVQQVHVDVYNHRISTVRGNTSRVLVDGVWRTLPVTLLGGAITVGRSGRYVVLGTDFKLTVSYDTDHTVEVKVPSSYFNGTCGMCGNYNNLRADEYMKPDGSQAKDSNELGNSWQVEDGDSSCSSGPVVLPECSVEEKEMIESKNYCGLIIDNHGPFKKCHSKVAPRDYFVNCVYDLCELNMDVDALCKSLQSYADMCQAHGVDLPPWRNSTFCSIPCGPNSHYEPCSTACPASCVNPNAPSTCNLPCVEDCVCDSGYLLHNDRCVSSVQCGCWHDGKHYPVGSEFWTDDTCSTKCTCPSRGGKLTCSATSCPKDYYCGISNGVPGCYPKLTCSATSCPKDYYCGISNGVPGCYPHTYGICRVHNDPHYNTFDKATHHFMGTCTYTLAKLCTNSSSLPYFNVEAKNENRGHPSISYVQQVHVDVYNHRISTVRGNTSRVLVDGVWRTLPVTLLGGAITVGRSGRYVVLGTDFKLTVSYDTDHTVEVKVPSSYFNGTCGMCGNYNNLRADEYMKPDGSQAKDSNELGNSWQVEDGDSSCCSSGPVVLPECSVEEKEMIESKNYCGLIIDNHGPFKKCHSKVAPRDYFVNCVYDLCELNMDVDALCKSLQSYADMCQAHGVDLPPWRNSTFCSIPCGPNSHYEPCSTACPASCVNPNAPSTCNLPCVEDCVCDSGYLLHNDRCVSSVQCGCWHDGKHYPVGSEFWTDDTCSTKCTCPSRGGKLTCSATSCPKDYYCGISNGVPGCYPHTYGICRVHNDPHYNTFDKATHHFMGTCTYTLAKLCTNSSSLPYFNVEAKNENRGHPSISYVQQVHVDVYNHRISTVRGNTSRVLVSVVPFFHSNISANLK
ncbi:hypothetical protein AOXY_G9115, partial [Acipenser oxyrinchus oxyrinchus]